MQKLSEFFPMIDILFNWPIWTARLCQNQFEKQTDVEDNKQTVKTKK